MGSIIPYITQPTKVFFIAHVYLHDIQHPIHASCRKQIQLTLLSFSSKKVEPSTIQRVSKHLDQNVDDSKQVHDLGFFQDLVMLYPEWAGFILELVILMMPNQGLSMSICADGSINSLYWG